MTTPQRPIDSGFDQHSTAADVLAGIDLTGRLAVVTGGYSGLGLETTRALAGAGATVIVVPRGGRGGGRGARGRRGRRSANSISRTSTASTRSPRSSWRGATTIDFLINNAAIMACPETRVGPGWEAQFATNHLGHFALVEPALAGARRRRRGAASSRVSSARAQALADPLGRPAVRARLRQVGGVRPGEDRQRPVRRRARRARQGRGVRAFARPSGRHPDAAAAPPAAARRWSAAAGSTRTATRRTSSRRREQGAATAAWAATAPLLDGIGGVYCEDCDIAEPASAEDETRGVAPYAVDPGRGHASLDGVGAAHRRRRARGERQRGVRFDP